MDDNSTTSVAAVEGITGELTAYETQNQLTAEQNEIVAERANSIDFDDTNAIQSFGAAAQQRMAGFAESALGKVRGKDMGESGKLITDLMVDLKGFNPSEIGKGIGGLFKKAGAGITKLQARYTAIETSVDKTVAVLKNHDVQLRADVVMLDKMYDENLNYFQDLTLYIFAGKQRLEAAASELEALKAKALQTGDQADAEAANHFAEAMTLFEKKIYDLELTREIAIQTAPQIRLIQAGDNAMINKINSTIVNTIPLWKSQLTIAMSLMRQEEAEKSQAAVDATTNELLKRNSAQLKTGTIEAAKASERGIVEIETLVQTNQDLITTLEEVSRIQEEGRTKRTAAEASLRQIEEELKAKLIQIRSS